MHMFDIKVLPRLAVLGLMLGACHSVGQSLLLHHDYSGICILFVARNKTIRFSFRFLKNLLMFLFIGWIMLIPTRNTRID